MDTLLSSFRAHLGVVVTLVGILIGGLGIAWSLFDWPFPVFSGALIEIGIAVGLVTAIVKLERRLIAPLEQRQDELSDRVDSLASDMTDLNEQIERARQERHEAQDESVRALESSPRADIVAAALREAREINAVADPLYIQASFDRNGLHLGISPVRETPEQTSRPMQRDDSVEFCFLIPNEGRITERRLIPGTTVFEDIPVRERWTSPQPAADFIVQLEQTLLRYGQQQQGMIDGAVFFSNLQCTLDIAIRTRRRDDPEMPHLNGQIIEVFQEGWYITTYGIECPIRDFSVRTQEILVNSPNAPQFVAEEEWQSMVDLVYDMNRFEF